jgi:hypothetical protein
MINNYLYHTYHVNEWKCLRIMAYGILSWPSSKKF